MSCPCGGETRLVSSERKKEQAVLQQIVCRSCGRAGGDMLLVRGDVVLKEIPARQAFNSITVDSANELWDHHQEEVRLLKEKRKQEAEELATQENGIEAAAPSPDPGAQLGLFA